ncbi:GNAT family N-acetyltransferase [Cohnella pontilimi]|uniref:GNAT family N-acetyltransferase n=1 Tax=Cohnella pontilimi TaxID=2564100 RepID=A0A4U0FCV5_9BACL|nr:GNAT family N-acetyltransferase [Cohnella pontilimi]TJY42733.1 GNAT family N-acetyltransferase [Cohnella pontilimi]
MNIPFGDYEISDDKKRLDLDAVHAMLNRSYWANNRTRETIERSVANSRCYGVYDRQGRQVAFARAITDAATAYYLCDVIVDEAHRRSGIGTKLVQSIVESEELRGLFGYLATDDAHGLYEKFGFRREPEKVMRKPREEGAR